MSDGERLRRALSELGTTWIKFGQMLSLRRELISDEVAEQLTLLQEQVPADDPEVVLALVEQELGDPCRRSSGRSLRSRWRRDQWRRFTAQRCPTAPRSR